MVRLTMTVPGNNIDGADPADIRRVDVFALTGLPTATAEDIVRRGARVGSIPVNPPPDPDAPEGAEPSPDRQLPGGVDQNGSAAVSEMIAVPTAGSDEFRSYVAVGINRRGRRGAPSAQVHIPLVPTPDAPAPPTLTHSETNVTLSWVSDSGGPRVHVYEIAEPEVRLSKSPIASGRFIDERITFGVERCYAIRLVIEAGGADVESDPSPRACVTPRDTFAPPAPNGLNAVPETGAVSLIWNPVDVPDLAGYIVLRAAAPAGELVPVNSEPLSDTTFRDTAPSGARLRYGVQAIDKSGNRGPVSATIEETVR